MSVKNLRLVTRVRTTPVVVRYVGDTEIQHQRYRTRHIRQVSHLIPTKKSCLLLIDKVRATVKTYI
jgi:hypothetical protein